MFEGKVALVTGSSRGIGKATALEFARRGANVIVNCSRSIEEANGVAEEIRSLGRRCVAIQADVSRETEVAQMIEQIIREFGRIDVLVNNAGTAVWKACSCVHPLK